MRSALGPSAVVLGAVLLSGCASGHGGSFAEGFIKPGEASLDLGGPPLVSALARQPGPPPESLIDRVPRPVSIGNTVESADPALAAALTLELVSPTASSHVRVAEEYRRVGVLDAAHARLVRALEKAPRMVAAHEALARLWRDWGFPHEALGAAYRAKYFDGGSARTVNTLGTVLDALGQLENARDVYQHALFVDPSAAWALNNLCYAEFRIGRPDEARLLCEAALRRDPQLTAARNNLALTYAAAGDFARAGEEFRAAGDPASAAYNLGMMHLAAGEHLPAAEAFERAIMARPNFSAAKTRAHAARMRVLTGSN